MSMKFVFTGKLKFINESKPTKNGTEYKRVVGMEKNGYRWTMFLFDNLVKLSNFKEEDFVEIKGTISKNSETKKEFFKISEIQILSKEKEEQIKDDKEDELVEDKELDEENELVEDDEIKKWLKELSEND